MAEYKQVDLQIGTEAQFESKKETLPIGAIVGITDPIHKSDLDSDLQTEINGKLTAPTTPTADSVVTMAANGTVGTKALSEFGGKLYKHKISIEFPIGSDIMFIYVTGLLSYNIIINTIDLLVENSTLLADIANVSYIGPKGNGGGVFSYVRYNDTDAVYKLNYNFGGTNTSLNLTGFTSITDTITEI